MVFKNLGEEKAMEIMKDFVSKGLSEDDAYMEVYSIECNLDNEELIEDIEF